MKLRNFGLMCYYFTVFILFSFFILNVLNIESHNNFMNHPNDLHTSGIINHIDEQWVENPTFIPPIYPWYPTIIGDASDVVASSIPNQAIYRIKGEAYEKQIILNSLTYSDWIPFTDSELAPNLGYGADSYGLYCGHDWNEPIGLFNNPISTINWRLNVSIDFDMSDYIITSANLNATINGTVNQDIDTPGDGTARWSPIVAINQSVYYDYAQFYIEISDLSLNELNTYRIAFNQTIMLGNDGTLNYDMEESIGVVTEQEIINAINNILSMDPGHNNFTINLGIYIYCEDNTLGFNYDRDQWEDLRFKFMNLTFGYENKIDQFTTVTWSQDLDKILGSHVKVINTNLSFKFKMDQTWPIASQNSEIRIFINDRKHDEVINLSNYVYSPLFQEAKLGGFNITSRILPYENFTLSIQLFLAENFGLKSNITISITDVDMYVSYTEFIPDIPVLDILNLVGPFLLAGIFILVSIVLASILHRTPKQRGLKDLSFTTGYPEVVRPNKPYWLSVYFHLPEYKDNVAKLIDIKEEKNGFETYIPTLESIIELKCAVTLKIIPNVKEITFEPIKQEIAWHKDIKEISFRLTADSKGTDRTLTGSIDIFKENLFIGQIPLSIKVSQGEEPTNVARTGSRKFESVFMSYSYFNEELVENFMEAYKRIDIDVNAATEKVHSGKWRKQIKRLIKISDVFQLYWSTQSSESEGVSEEWREALKYVNQKGYNFIRGCYWETPMPDLPKELGDFHFFRIKLKNLALKRKIKKKLTKKPKKSRSSE